MRVRKTVEDCRATLPDRGKLLCTMGDSKATAKDYWGLPGAVEDYRVTLQDCEGRWRTVGDCKGIAGVPQRL